MKRIAMSLALTTLLSGCAMSLDDEGQGVENSQALADTALAGKHLWPRGKIVGIYDFGSSSSLGRFFQVALNTTNERGRAQNAFEAALGDVRRELETFTPLRLILLNEGTPHNFKKTTQIGLFTQADGSVFDSGVVAGRSTVGTLETNEERVLQAVEYGVPHMIGHAAGLGHTNTREDAGEHIQIFHERIPEDFKKYLEPLTAEHSDLGPYDLDSLMHLGSFAGTDGGECPLLLQLGAPDTCDPQSLSPYVVRQHRSFSTWNYTVLSAMYCFKKFAGSNLVVDGRCSSEIVRRNLDRYMHWESTGETRLPASKAVCGDGLLDGGEECDGQAFCTDSCTFVAHCEFSDGSACTTEFTEKWRD